MKQQNRLLKCGCLTLLLFFFADYDSSGAVEFKDPVSFRLTPNLQNFITRAGVDGPFLASMRAAAQAIAHEVLPLFLFHNGFKILLSPYKWVPLIVYHFCI